MITVFWVLIALTFYSVIGYFLLIAFLSGCVRKRVIPCAAKPFDVVLIVAAHNEERHIREKIGNSLDFDPGEYIFRLIVACDGCTDRTVELARAYADPRVTILENVPHVGKVGALNLAIRDLTADVLVFSDANSRVDRSALNVMLRHFADPSVGGVCGAIGVPEHNRGWVSWGEAIYWKFDHVMKSCESQVAGAVSAQGSLYAVRRSLVSTIPDAVADDLYISLLVVAQGFRLVFEPAAQTFENVSSSENAEFGRRVRSTEQSWRTLIIMGRLFNPFRYGFYSVQLFSHKVLRRLVPFMAIALFFTAVVVADRGGLYASFAAGLAVTIGAVLLSWLMRRWLPGWAAIPAFLLFANLAMMIGVINAVRGKRSSRWKPARGE